MEGGCLAWSIVFSSFLIHFLESGFSDTFCLILPAIRKTFHASNAEASLANSLVVFLTLGISPVAAWLSARIGNRLTLALGVILASSGLFASGVYIDVTSSKYELLTNGTDDNNIVTEDIRHPNILLLYATVGIFTGIGFGLTYLPAMTVIKMYFNKHLGLACGIANAGTGFGQFLMAPVITFLLKNFSLAIVLYFFGSTFLASFPLSFIFKSVKKTKDRSEIDDKDREGRSSWNEILLVLRTPSKLLLVVHVFLLNIGIYAVFTYFAERARSFGISENKTSTLVSIMGFSNFLARILSGVIIDKFRSRTFLILTSVHMINGVSILISQFLQSFPAQAITAIIFGAGFGTKVTCMVVLVSIIDDDITHLLSIIYLSVGVASLIGPSFVGYLLDVTGSHLLGFVTISILFILGALCLPISWFLYRRKQIISEETKM